MPLSPDLHEQLRGVLSTLVSPDYDKFDVTIDGIALHHKTDHLISVSLGIVPGALTMLASMQPAYLTIVDFLSEVETEFHWSFGHPERDDTPAWTLYRDGKLVSRQPVLRMSYSAWVSSGCEFSEFECDDTAGRVALMHLRKAEFTRRRILTD